jgi:hypothetical protein
MVASIEMAVDLAPVVESELASQEKELHKRRDLIGGNAFIQNSSKSGVVGITLAYEGNETQQ